MSSPTKNTIGTIGWIDLTVPEAEKIRDFYAAVAAWKAAPVSMGEYDDFSMVPLQGDSPVAGICHARGVNAGIPPQWMIYIHVADLDRAMEKCTQLGGRVKFGPTALGGEGRFCVIEDPAGAVAALFEAPAEEPEEKTAES